MSAEPVIDLELKREELRQILTDYPAYQKKMLSGAALERVDWFIFEHRSLISWPRALWQMLTLR